MSIVTRVDLPRWLASVWIWTNITQGDHIYAPAIRPVLRRPSLWWVDRPPHPPTMAVQGRRP